MNHSSVHRLYCTEVACLVLKCFYFFVYLISAHPKANHFSCKFLFKFMHKILNMFNIRLYRSVLVHLLSFGVFLCNSILFIWSKKWRLQSFRSLFIFCVFCWFCKIKDVTLCWYTSISTAWLNLFHEKYLFFFPVAKHLWEDVWMDTGGVVEWLTVVWW